MVRLVIDISVEGRFEDIQLIGFLSENLNVPEDPLSCVHIIMHQCPVFGSSGCDEKLLQTVLERKHCVLYSRKNIV